LTDPEAMILVAKHSDHDLVGKLDEAQRRLRRCESVGQLLAQAAQLGRTICGFDRVVIAGVHDSTLSCRTSAALTHEPSDGLRRQLNAARVRLESRTTEAEVVRRPHAPPGPVAPTESPLAQNLGLRCYAFAAVAPESETLALLIADRAAGAVTVADLERLRAYARTVGFALEHVVLRSRVKLLVREITHFVQTAGSLGQEALEAPVQMPTDFGFGVSVPSGGVPAERLGAPIEDVLSSRERGIVALIAEGRSNREIADALVLSAETVKSHVTRILRKLGAANRMEAVARYRELAARPHADIDEAR
jgi:ATP/maltotriose-dependent transcriptional regulator MalT